MSSDRAGTIPYAPQSGTAGKYLSSDQPLAALRPQPDEEAPVRRIFDGVGRPSATETAARTRDLIAQLAAGKTLLDAARTAGVKPDRVLRLLEEPEFFAAFSAFRQEYAA